MNYNNEKLTEKILSGEIDTFEAIKLLNQYDNINKTNNENVSNSKLIATNENDVAIIGISCKFPDTDNVDEFWNNLKLGKNSVREIKRWDKKDYYDTNKNREDKSYSKWGGLLENISKFDEQFFNITPKEAELMDPQQRIFLMEAWKAFEDAGYSNYYLDGKNCGVFVGVADNSYKELLTKNNINPSAFSFIGNNESILSSRISYLLNLKGPSITINTACSSSLVAIHYGYKSIVNNECEMALVGGINIFSTPSVYKSTSKCGMLSETGMCNTFDDNANGFVPGEGCGLLVIKSLKNAIEDNDHIYSVIKGVVLNQDGKTNGITSPNSLSQEELETNLYKQYNINPRNIGYLEAHGTGTKLGDPIEIDALTSSFSKFTDEKQFCAIGSVKTNIGHTISTAGVASVIKGTLLLKNKMLVPTLNFNNINRNINIDNSPFYINTELKKWESNSRNKRLVAINSFGFSGTNAHLVLEEFQSKKAKNCKTNNKWPIVFSAKTEKSLKDILITFKNCVNEKEDLRNISYTLLVGRSHFNKKIVLIVENMDELKNEIEKLLQNENFGMMYKESIIKEIDSNSKNKLDRINLDNNECFSSESLTNIKYLYLQGYLINWQEKFTGHDFNKVSLPTYKFDTKDFWINDDISICEKRKEAKFLEENLMEYPLKNGMINKLEKIVVIDDNEALVNRLNEVGFTNVELIKKDFLNIKNSLNFDTVIINTENKKNKFDDIENVDGYLNDYTISIFNIIKEVLNKNNNINLKIFNIVRNLTINVNPILESIEGIGKTVVLEYPLISFKNINFSTVGYEDNLINQLVMEISNSSNERSIYYDENFRRYIFEYKQVSVRNRTEAIFKTDGNYIITGGTSGIGYIFANYLSNKIKGNIFVLSRSEINNNIKLKLERLNSKDAKVYYKQCDIGNYNKLNLCLAEIKNKYGNITGIIHSAGVFRESFISRKTVDEFKEVLNPKVQGTINLDRLLRNEKLDFFIMFSSIASIIGKIGQVDYVYSNRFIDNYSKYRNSLVDKGERFGNSIAINWPYWINGGMKLDKEDLSSIKDKYALELMEDEEGLNVFEKIMTHKLTNNIVFYGDTRLFEKKINDYKRNNKDNTVQSYCTTNIEDIFDILRNIICEETGFKNEEITINTKIAELNIDSIVVNSFNLKIEEIIYGLPKTILYEFDDFYTLSKYILDNYKLSDNIKSCEEENYQKEVVEKNTTKPQENLSEEEFENEDIAIIGMSGLYPGADNLDEFWNILKNGESKLSGFPIKRWADQEKDMSIVGKDIYCTQGGFLKDVDKFDPLVFNISPNEAVQIDPQERKFLEIAFNAMEDSGYNKKTIDINMDFGARVGVFVGVTSNTYNNLSIENWKNGEFKPANSHPWSIANRVSYYFNFTGPSIAVDTACSSGLVALHYGCESLKRKECKVALVGGVNIYAHPEKYALLCEKKMLSESGKCNSFGDEADGFVPGEGVGAIVIKPLKQAIIDKDNIYSIIKSTAINHGGRSTGYFVPNLKMQVAVIKDALNKAKIDYRSISSIEAHGTGTKLGDPIEIAALNNIFRVDNNKENYCAIGSVKSNIGHLESASGIASITKMVLMLKNKEIVKTLNSDKLNENLDLKRSPFYFPQELTKWNTSNEIYPRRGGVSSFGAGGVNAHVILEEYKHEILEKNNMDAYKILPISANSFDKIKAIARDILGYLNSKNEENIIHNISEQVINFRSIGENTYDELKSFQDYEEICIDKICIYFQSKGFFKVLGEEVTIDELIEGVGLSNKFIKLFNVILNSLVTNKIIYIENGKITTIDIRKINSSVVEEKRRRILEKYPEISVYDEMLTSCLDNYFNILSGNQSPMEVLFNNKNPLAEKIYTSEITNVYNEVLGKAVAKITEEKITKDTVNIVRILEIGAGTGATSEFVINKIKNYSGKVIYYFTDVSPYFLEKAKTKFKDSAIDIEYEILDITNIKNIDKLNVKVDIILATNVFHATKNIMGTLKNCYTMLNSNGALLINEITSKFMISSLTFGLLDGWWNNEDRDRRISESPLLSVSKWREALKEAGYIDINNTKFSEYSSQNILIAIKKEILKKENKNIDDIAFTLQRSIHSFKRRVVLVAKDVNEFKELLEQLIAKDNIKQNLCLYNDSIEQEIKQQAELWINGKEDVFLNNYNNGFGRAVSLPKYKFEKESYWRRVNNKQNGRDRINDVIDENLSTLKRQKFRKNINGSNELLKVNVEGNEYLNGLIYLEMMINSSQISLEENYLKFEKIMWSKPVLFSNLVTLDAYLINKDGINGKVIFTDSIGTKGICMINKVLTSSEYKDNSDWISEKLDISKTFKSENNIFKIIKISDDRNTLLFNYNFELRKSLNISKVLNSVVCEFIHIISTNKKKNYFPISIEVLNIYSEICDSEKILIVTKERLDQNKVVLNIVLLGQNNKIIAKIEGFKFILV